MREIKFRAWTYGKMNYFDNPKNGLLYRCEEVILSSGWDSYKQPTFDGDPEFELMQFTGLKDKNGVEIYEGDIVSRGDGNFVVQYKNDKHYIGYVATVDDKTQSYIHIWYDNIEVIGNIYESPELLKQ